MTIIAEALKHSVIDHPDTRRGNLRVRSFSWRGPILPAWGTRERERTLRKLWRHDYNTLFRGSIAGLIKRVQSTPWEIKADAHYGDRWQRVLMNADFGDWDRFIAKLITDYSRHDQGAFIELIAPGDPREAPTGPMIGMSILDSLRCYPTGDPYYPVIYYDLHGAMHVLHRGRVIQFVDSPDSEEDLPGYGDCALSRCIAPVYRQILMGRYIEQFLDDKPPPGIMVFGNIGDDTLQTAIERMYLEQSTDSKGEWGRTVKLFSLHAEVKPTVDIISHTRPPEKFDFTQYTNIDVREIALGIGLDIQDIWELTGQGLGTGRQSEILSQKSRGKAFGRILKGLERVINRALPEDVEFSWKYEDPQADLEQAQILQSTATSMQVLSNDLSADERRTLLANTNPAVRDVVMDEKGQVRRLADADLKTDEQTKLDIHAAAPPQAEAATAVKAFSTTASAFAARFASLVDTARSGQIGPGALRAILRDYLYEAGAQAYRDGLIDGGANPDEADAEELARRRRVVAEWLASQTQYVTAFVDELLAQGLSADQAALRADMWAAKSLRIIYFAGLQDAGEQQIYEWQLGMTEQHCQTCLALNGQRHQMKQYVDAGLLPGSSALECNGYQCDCRLVKVQGRSRGTLPGARPTLGDRLTRWIGGLFRGRRG